MTGYKIPYRAIFMTKELAHSEYLLSTSELVSQCTDAAAFVKGCPTLPVRRDWPWQDES